MRVEKCAFLLHNCIFTLLIFVFRRSKNCPRSHFFCSPHHFSRFSSLEKLPPAPSRQYITDYNRDRETDMKLKYGLVTSAIEANAEDCCYISIDDIGVRFQKAKRNCSYNKKAEIYREHRHPHTEGWITIYDYGTWHEECLCAACRLFARQQPHERMSSCVPHRWCQVY